MISSSNIFDILSFQRVMVLDDFYTFRNTFDWILIFILGKFEEASRENNMLIENLSHWLYIILIKLCMILSRKNEFKWILMKYFYKESKSLYFRYWYIFNRLTSICSPNLWFMLYNKQREINFHEISRSFNRGIALTVCSMFFRFRQTF